MKAAINYLRIMLIHAYNYITLNRLDNGANIVRECPGLRSPQYKTEYFVAF